MLTLADLRGDRRVLEEIGSLSKNNISVSVIYPVKVRNKPVFVKEQNVKIFHVYLSSETLFHKIKGFLFHLGTAIMFAELIYKVGKKLKTEKFDYVHCHDTNALLLAFIANRFKPINLVYDAHELYPETVKNKAVKSFWTKFENYILPKLSNRIIATNKQRADFMVTKYKLDSHLTLYDNSSFKKIDVSKYIINEKIKLLQKKGYKVLVHLGALTNNRDLDKLLLSILTLKSVAVVFIGHNFGFKALNSSTIKSLDDRFVHIDQVEQKEILAWINGCDIGIVFYRQTNMNNIFAAPNKIYDYMSMEIPTLGSDSPTISNILDYGTYGEVVDSNDSQEITVMINKMLDSIEDYKSNLKQGKGILHKKYSRETQNKKLVSFYQQLNAKQ